MHVYSGTRSVEDLRCYERLTWDLSDEVTLVFREGVQRGRLEYDVCVADAASLERLVIRVEGATRLTSSADGELLCHVRDDHAEGEGQEAILRHTSPVTFGIDARGRRVPLRARFRIVGEQCYGFVLEDTAWRGEVVVDPGLVWSSYFGGSGRVEGIFDLHVDPDGTTYVCGFTDSVLFNVTSGAQQPRFGGGALDGFLARIAPDGKTLAWCTYIGGGGEDSLIRLAKAPDSSLYAAGYSASANFPLLQPIQKSLGGNVQDAVITRWTDQGKLRFSTYFGGTASEVARGIAFDAAGRAYVGGITNSVNFPTTANSYQRVLAGSWDAFALVLDGTTDRLLHSTMVGGLNVDDLWSIDVSPAGDVVMAITTQSPFLPTTTGALQTSFAGGAADGYLFGLDKALGSRTGATYLGGISDDRLNAIRLLGDGSIAVCGWSDSANLPTANAFQGVPTGNYDGYVAHVAKDFKSLVWGTYVGGGANDFLWDLDVDAASMWTVAGLTYANDFPVTAGAYKSTIGRNGSNGGDGVVVRIAPWLRPFSRELVYASYVGGNDYEYVYALDVRNQEATIAGETSSTNYETTTGAFQTTRGGNTGEGMVTRLDLLPASCTRFGVSSPCKDEWPFEPSENAAKGITSFAMITGGLPPSTAGILALGVPTSKGLPILGAVAYLDPLFPILTFPMASDANGHIEIALPLPTQSLRFALQAFFLRATNCQNGGPLISSPAIEIRVQ